MKNILNFETVQDFTSAYTGNPDAIPTPVPGVAYVRENGKVKYNSRPGVTLLDRASNNELKHITENPWTLTKEEYVRLGNEAELMPTEGNVTEVNINFNDYLVTDIENGSTSWSDSQFVYSSNEYGDTTIRYCNGSNDQYITITFDEQKFQNGATAYVSKYRRWAEM